MPERVLGILISHSHALKINDCYIVFMIQEHPEKRICYIWVLL